MWRNKADLDTMRMDDLYNNLKVYEPEVKGMSSSSSSTQNIDFVSSLNNNTSSTNRAVNTAQAVNITYGMSTSSTQVNAAYSINIDNLSDAVICLFFASQPNSPQLIHEDLELIHLDDMEEIYFRWQMAMLTMRAIRFLKKTGNNLTVNGNETIGFDKSNVECYNCHKREHFAREYLVSCDGLGGYDWSDQAEEGQNYALMAFSSSSSDSTMVDNYKKGLGYENYNAVPPPYTENFMPPKLDLSFTGLDEFVNNPVVENYNEEEDVSQPKIKKKTVRPSIAKIEFIKSKQQEKTARKTVKQVEQHRQNTHSPRGNQRNWNNMMTQKLGSNFEMFNKACYVCGSFDHLQDDEGFFVGYSLNSKAFRVFNSITRIVEENLHIRFSESAPNVLGSGLDWLFDIDALTITMNYEPIIAGTQSNGFVGTKASDNAGQARKETEPIKYYIFYHYGLLIYHYPKMQRVLMMRDPNLQVMMERRLMKIQEKKMNVMIKKKKDNVNNTNNVNTVSLTVNTTGINRVNDVGENISIELEIDPNMPALEDVSTFYFSRNDEDDGAIADMNNLNITIQVRYTQEELIDYDEVFALVARIEAIRLFLAYASFKDFVVYQMNVKSDFLYGKIEEEVKIDKTLFIKRHKSDILLVPVYVDDIIFSLTKKELCFAFKKLMHEKFQMSSMGELTFFLELQVKQRKDGTFISQDKYIAKILKKFGFTEVKTVSTPMETQKPLLKDEDGEEVDVHMYRSMIGSFMYLIFLRPDIMFAVCAYARYQVNLKVSHLYSMKRISRYLKGQPKLGIWYPKDSPFNLVAYTDSDYARASLDKKSTTKGYQFLRCRLISWQCKK
nr:hypothetical protein [Tanacetum cinerariifolium]GEX46100.1 hypothetical protein [Tanacetum cinerariifolium]